MAAWRATGAKVAVLSARDEAELTELYVKAKGLGLAAAIVADAGRTEVRPGSITAVAVGPGPSTAVDCVTKLQPTLRHDGRAE